MYKRYFKRFFDFVISVVGLFILFPIFIIITIMLFLANNGKPFFFQLRPGKDEKIFKIIKFKTMNDKKDSDGNLLPDSKRLTAVGKFVRKTSLDEIPQLINVLKGDMSLIGPRPLLIKYLKYYTEQERVRHTIRPGITGLAQVTGRNLMQWDERLALDVKYVNDIRFTNDCKIIVETIKNVIFSKNIVIDPESVMKNLDDERKN